MANDVAHRPVFGETNGFTVFQCLVFTQLECKVDIGARHVDLIVEDENASIDNATRGD